MTLRNLTSDNYTLEFKHGNTVYAVHATGTHVHILAQDSDPKKGWGTLYDGLLEDIDPAKVDVGKAVVDLLRHCRCTPDADWHYETCPCGIEGVEPLGRLTVCGQEDRVRKMAAEALAVAESGASEVTEA